MSFLTTVLCVLFAFGAWFGFFVFLGILLGDRKPWMFLYLIGLVALFLLIGKVMPANYRSPFGSSSSDFDERAYHRH